MTIQEALKSKDFSVRVVNYSNWLIWDDSTNEWVVYTRPYYAKKTKILYHGKNESGAVRFLIGE